MKRSKPIGSSTKPAPRKKSRPKASAVKSRSAKSTRTRAAKARTSASTTRTGKNARVRRTASTTPTDLLSWQRLMHAAITRPLADGDMMQPQWTDGRPIEAVVNPLVKGNDRLGSVERLQIYNRMYWYRLMDCVADDCPGLRAFLGEDGFWKLVVAYLNAYPSRSYTLRNLCSQLIKFVQEEPKWTTPHNEAALELVQFEWAQIVAFDGETLAPFDEASLTQVDPDKLRVRLQPYMTLLHLEYAVDEYVLAVKQGDHALRGTASQAVVKRRKARAVKSAAGKAGPTSAEESINGLRKQPLDVVVHRVDNILYYKRLDPAAAVLLRALDAGQSLASACARAMRGSALSPEKQAEQIRSWFALWMRLGWLCPRAK
jgi:hypothetical protein